MSVQTASGSSRQRVESSTQKSPLLDLCCRRYLKSGERGRLLGDMLLAKFIAQADTSGLLASIRMLCGQHEQD